MLQVLKTATIIVSILFAALMAQAQQKPKYTSEEGKFSIKFPGEYAVEIDDNEKAKTVKPMCTLNGQTYLASYTLHQTEMIDHDEMEEISVDSFGEAIQAELLSKSVWQVDEQSGIIAFFKIADADIKVEYRVMLVEQLQYQVIVLAANSDYDEGLAAKFFKSFKLLE